MIAGPGVVAGFWGREGRGVLFLRRHADILPFHWYPALPALFFHVAVCRALASMPGYNTIRVTPVVTPAARFLPRVQFVRALTSVSYDELRDARAPRVFSLTKIVEVAHFNMTRIRCGGARSEHCVLRIRIIM